MAQRSRHSMNTKQNQHIRLYQGHRRTLSAIVIAGLVWALIYVKSSVSDYYNGGTVVIKIDQTKYIGADFHNDSLGSFQNEGELYFQKDITNNGTMNCGGCTSGVNYFNSANSQTQTIQGSQPVIMYDVILDNTGNVSLENELRIVNSLQFVNGLMQGNPNDSNVFVHFMDGATFSGASKDSHIKGHVKKTGSGAFTFPIGDGSNYFPIGIEGASSGTAFQVAYVSLTSNSGSAYFPDGTAFQTSAYESSIAEIHSREYWDVKGDAFATITLYWNPENQLSDLITDINKLTVAGWNGSTWVNLGQNSLTGNISSGSIQTDSWVPDDYQAFTFARLTDSPLPVEWLSFDLVEVNGDLELQWSTSMETGVDKFEIERSTDNFNGFKAIGQLPATGFSSEEQHYIFMDTEVNTRTSTSLYYRLKQIDLDGGFSYSKTIQWQGRESTRELEFSLFPNPARDYVIFELQTNLLSNTQLDILNLQGENVWRQPVKVSDPINIPLDHLSEGVYIFRLRAQGYSVSKRILKK